MLRRLIQQALIGVVRPYVAAELPGWGPVYSSLIGTYKRDAFWSNAPTRRGRNKFFGFECEFDLRLWADRQAFFLGRWYDLPTQLLARAVGGGTIVDIGANRGDFAMAAAAMFPEGRVIAFEPNPNISLVLKRDLADNHITNVEVRECALGDREESLRLHVPFANSGSASFGGFVAEGFTTQALPVRVGDDELRDVDPDFIKIDVEGFELKALKGLRQTIERAKPIIETELMEENLARCGTSRKEVESFMCDLGFKGFGMDLARNGSDHELRLGKLGTTWDAVWLPAGVDPNSLRASTKDLRQFKP
jgi:FkbM family methyltransferase